MQIKCQTEFRINERMGACLLGSFSFGKNKRKELKPEYRMSLIPKPVYFHREGFVDLEMVIYL